MFASAASDFSNKKSKGYSSVVLALSYHSLFIQTLNLVMLCYKFQSRKVVQLHDDRWSIGSEQENTV